MSVANAAVMIPAHNEAPRIAATVGAALAIAGVATVLVVDDGSSDGTADLAQAAGADVLHLSENGGKGAALTAGCEALGEASGLAPGLHSKLDYLLLLDADLGASASEASLLLEPLIADGADLVIAQLPSPPGPGGFGLVKGLARGALEREGFAARAPVSGQRALRMEHLPALMPFASGFGVEVAMTIRALRAGLRVLEVPTQMTHAATGRDLAGFLHRARQYRDIRRALRGI